MESTPGICGGKPRISGHRIRVMDVAVWHRLLGLSLAEIVAAYPTLTLSDVEAAVEFYERHRDEIDSDIEREDQLIAELRRESPSLLQQKLRQTGGS
ncbi:MAG: DUF433 domain-containing protein [Acidobacteriota bacterium]|nr:DUF433 domain-containing protein [Acidobacteriota bacterium]